MVDSNDCMTGAQSADWRTVTQSGGGGEGGDLGFRVFREYVLLGSSRYRQIDIVRTGSHGLIGG